MFALYLQLCLLSITEALTECCQNDMRLKLISTAVARVNSAQWQLNMEAIPPSLGLLNI